jgi:hypothetical protein
LLSLASGFMDVPIMCDSNPQHSHGLQMISGVKDDRRAKRDYLNKTRLPILASHRVDDFFESGIDEPTFCRGIRLATHFVGVYVEIKSGLNPSDADCVTHRPVLSNDVIPRNLTIAMMRLDYLTNISVHARLPQLRQCS